MALGYANKRGVPYSASCIKAIHLFNWRAVNGLSSRPHCRRDKAIFRDHRDYHGRVKRTDGAG